MTIKLTEDEIARRDQLAAKIDAARADVRKAYRKMAQECLPAMDAYMATVDDYNEKLSEACDWLESVIERVLGEINDRSDRWRESKLGVDTSEWLNSFIWTTHALADVDGLPEIERPKLEHANVLRNLAEQP